MRLFVAIDLPEKVKDQLGALKADIPGARWVKPAQMHLTLRFIGDQVSESQFQQIKTALAAIEAEAFELSLQGVGRFPPSPKKAARVLWVGITPQPRLNVLYQKVEAAVRSVGFPADDHDFNPHITLARVQSDKLSQAISTFLEANACFQSETIPVDQFYLYSSLLSPQGPRYQREATLPLKPA
jgi:RNA 2',3'-cyclic 3'-phosphodiesterase